jgi:hypothetical protein
MTIATARHILILKVHPDLYLFQQTISNGPRNPVKVKFWRIHMRDA